MNPIPRRAGTVELLFARAQSMGLQPAWITEGGLFVVTTDKGERYVNHGRSSLNSHVGIGLARNKFHTRLVLERHNLPNIPFMQPQSRQQAEAFLDMHDSIIVKPIKSSGSKNIRIVHTQTELRQLSLDKSILEKYTPGREMRYLALNGEVIGVYESKYGRSVDEHRYLECVSYDSDSWDPELVDMSVEISQILGLSFAAVDYLIDDAGKAYILEVNTRPDFKWFHAPSAGPVVDVATYFLKAMLGDAQAVAHV